MSTSSGFVPKHWKTNKVPNDGVYQNTLEDHHSVSPLYLQQLFEIEKFCSKRLSKSLH